MIELEKDLVGYARKIVRLKNDIYSIEVSLDHTLIENELDDYSIELYDAIYVLQMDLAYIIKNAYSTFGYTAINDEVRKLEGPSDISFGEYKTGNDLRI